MKADENLVHFIKSHYEEEIQKGLGLFADYMHEISIEKKNRKLYLINVPS